MIMRDEITMNDEADVLEFKKGSYAIPATELAILLSILYQPYSVSAFPSLFIYVRLCVEPKFRLGALNSGFLAQTAAGRYIKFHFQIIGSTKDVNAGKFVPFIDYLSKYMCTRWQSSFGTERHAMLGQKPSQTE